MTDLPRSPGRRYAPLAVTLPACWDPAGRRLAVAVREGIAVLHVDDRDTRLLAAREEVRAIAWSPDGTALALACDGRDLQSLVRVTDGAELWRSSLGESAVDEVVWSPDGRSIAYVGDDLVVCAAGTGAELWRRSETRGRTIAGVVARGDRDRPRLVERVRFEDERVPTTEAHWSADTELLAARWDDVFRVLDARDGAVEAEGTIAGGVLRWTDGGQALFSDGTHRLALCTSQITDRAARTLTFSRDGRFLAAEGDAHRLWIQDEHGLRALPGHPRTITAMAWSESGVLATACRDGVVRRWSPGDDAPRTWAHIDVTYGGLSWSPDGAYLAACCTDSVVLLPAAAMNPARP